MKDCPVPHCTSRIALEFDVCRWHFARLPGWIQREYQRTRDRGPEDAEFRRALEAALEFLIPDLSYLERRAS